MLDAFVNTARLLTHNASLQRPDQILCRPAVAPTPEYNPSHGVSVHFGRQDVHITSYLIANSWQWTSTACAHMLKRRSTLRKWHALHAHCSTLCVSFHASELSLLSAMQQRRVSVTQNVSGSVFATSSAHEATHILHIIQQSGVSIIFVSFIS